MHHVTRVLFGPSPSEIRAKLTSKKPLLRYLVDKREELRNLPPHEFLATSFAFLHSPFALPDMSEAVEDLLNYTSDKKHILLYGDRDSDGVSSTCLLAFFLKAHPFFAGLKISVLNSTDSDPYGLCEEAIVKIKKIKPDMLITLDFGSSQADEVDLITSMGIKVIILDHHEIPTRIPSDTLLISPRRLDSIYPEDKICTSSLSFKLVHAILFRLSNEFGKIYQLNDSGNIIFFRNGLRLGISFTPNAESPISIFPDRSLYDKNEVPTDHERFLFYVQCKNVPGLFDMLLEEVDLAGIGTITDMMPLIGENRMIVKLAISSLRRKLDPNSPKKRVGIEALLKQLELQPAQISTKDLGWSIGPALNAAGRMGKTEEAVSLLLSENRMQAEKKAKDLLQINSDRKERTARNLDRVNRYFARKPERTEKPVTFCYEPDLEPGVSGIVATKMVNDFKKPAIFITPDNGDARGSIRTYGKENALDLLNMVSEHFLHYGGHPEAAGFSMELSKVAVLEKAIYEKCALWLKTNPLLSLEFEYETDITVLPEELNDKLFREWNDLEPFGQMNPDILIGLRKIKPIHLTPLSGGKHIKFNVMSGGSIKFMIWNKGEEFQKLASEYDHLDFIGKLEENNFRGKTTLQFIIEWFGKAEEVTHL